MRKTRVAVGINLGLDVVPSARCCVRHWSDNDSSFQILPVHYLTSNLNVSEAFEVYAEHPWWARCSHASCSKSLTLLSVFPALASGPPCSWSVGIGDGVGWPLLARGLAAFSTWSMALVRHCWCLGTLPQWRVGAESRPWELCPLAPPLGFLRPCLQQCCWANAVCVLDQKGTCSRKEQC